MVNGGCGQHERREMGMVVFEMRGDEMWAQE